MLLPNRDRCTGCGSCAAVCPKNCIRMVSDFEGFLNPKIQQDQCIGCKKCEKACAVLELPKVSASTKILAAKNIDTAVRLESSSGGIFTALAEKIIDQGGVVCAAVYDEAFAVEHRLAFTMQELAMMRGAKYVQSHAGHLFGRLKELLAAGKTVLFVGTPCQCAGLKSYLGQDYEHLVLVDMICHGVPAPTVWKAYLDRRRVLDAGGAQIASINLREKTTGWSKYAYSVMFRYTNGHLYSVRQGQDPYMRGFVGNLYLRPSCSDCSFKGIRRCSDLSLGDCWGIWDTHPEFDDDRGVSVLLIHSAKGQMLWSAISSQFHSMQLTEEDVTNYNSGAVHSSAPHPRRGAFFDRLSAGEPVDELISNVLLENPPKKGVFKRILDRLLRV